MSTSAPLPHRVTAASKETNPSARLELLQDAFYVLAKCTAELRKNNVQFEDRALDHMIANLGERLVRIGLDGGEQQIAELTHWKDHGEARCRQLITLARANDGVINWEDVHTMWLKPPGPRIIVLDDTVEVQQSVQAIAIKA